MNTHTKSNDKKEWNTFQLTRITRAQAHTLKLCLLADIYFHFSRKSKLRRDECTTKDRNGDDVGGIWGEVSERKEHNKKVNLDMDFNFGSTNRIVLRGTCTSHIRRRHSIDMWVRKNQIEHSDEWASMLHNPACVRGRACCVLCTDIFSLKFDQTGINHWETFAGTIWCLNGMNLIRTFILDAFCSSIYLFELYFTAQATYHYVSFHFYCCCCCCLLTLLLYDGNPILFARSHFIFASRTFLLFCRSLCSSPCFNRSHTVPLLRQPSAFGFILFPSIAYDDFNLENWINILLFVTIVHEN